MNSLGLATRNWELIKAIALIPLEAAGCEVWAFGSRARNDHKEFSDLDLLVIGMPSTTLLNRIREQLEESSVPIKVDLVADSELAQAYRASVYQDRIRLHGS